MMEEKYTFKENQKEDCFKIRRIVYMEEQGFENEFDEIDNVCTFLTLYDGSRCIGCLRLFTDENKGMIMGRLALLKEYRGKGLGKKLILQSEKLVKKMGYQEIHLHAQCYLQKMYEKLNYSAYGEIELDEGVEHIWMKKTIL